MHCLGEIPKRRGSRGRPDGVYLYFRHVEVFVSYGWSFACIVNLKVPVLSQWAINLSIIQVHEPEMLTINDRVQNIEAQKGSVTCFHWNTYIINYNGRTNSCYSCEADQDDSFPTGCFSGWHCAEMVSNVKNLNLVRDVGWDVGCGVYNTVLNIFLNLVKSATMCYIMMRPLIQ